MNNPNPFIPQGSLLEQRNKKRARVKVAVLAIFACNILLVGPLLLNGGCRHGDTTADNESTTTKTETATTESNNITIPSLATTSNTATASNPLAVAPPAVPPTPPLPPATTEYVVVKGDNLATIASTHHVKLKDLEAANPTVVPTKLALGYKLKIPEATSATTMGVSATEAGENIYVVKQGDNLTKIATAHGTTVKELMALNGLKTSAIKAKDKLKLPAKSSTTSSPMETVPPGATASNLMPGTPVMR